MMASTNPPTCSKSPSRFSPIGWLPRPTPEALLFWTMAAVYLIPIWAFPYFPTQDIITNISNAAIAKVSMMDLPWPPPSLLTEPDPLHFLSPEGTLILS